MRQRRFLILAIAAFVTACDATPPAANDASAALTPAAATAPQTAPAGVATTTARAASTATTAPDPDPAATLESTLKKGMAYADLRTAALAAGWLPLSSPDCRENIGGEAAICAQLPELDACSSDGRCTMRFARGVDAPVLRVDASGDYLQWRATGAQAALTVDAWSFTPPARPASAMSCPSTDFPTFLRAFAADKATQRAFTLPLLKVAQMDVGEDVAPHDTYQRAEDYRGFILDHRADGFYVVPDIGKPSRVDPDVTADGAQAFVVRYRYGMSEGNSYRFEMRSGCWHLVADPEPPIS